MYISNSTPLRTPSGPRVLRCSDRPLTSDHSAEKRKRYLYTRCKHTSELFRSCKYNSHWMWHCQSCVTIPYHGTMLLLFFTLERGCSEIGITKKGRGFILFPTRYNSWVIGSFEANVNPPVCDDIECRYLRLGSILCRVYFVGNLSFHLLHIARGSIPIDPGFVLRRASCYRNHRIQIWDTFGVFMKRMSNRARRWWWRRWWGWIWLR